MSYLFSCGRAAYLFLIPGPPSLLCSDERDFLFWMQSCLEPFQKTKNKTHNRLYSWQAPESQATKKSTSESKKSTSESLHMPWILHSCDENVCGFLSCSINTFVNYETETSTSFEFQALCLHPRKERNIFHFHMSYTCWLQISWSNSRWGNRALKSSPQ